MDITHDSIKVLPAGSLAILLDTKSLNPEVCLVLRVLPRSSWNSFGMPVYLILTKDGRKQTYTSAAIRFLDESG